MPIKNNQGSDNIPQLRFPEFKGEWEKKKLGEIFSISAGGDIESKNVSQVKTDVFKYPIYANAEKDKGFYGYSDIYKVEENVLTVAGRGVNIGIAHARNHKFYPIVRLLVLKPLNNENIYFFENEINRLELFKESTGVPQLTAPQISGYEVCFPSLPEQTKIASFLTVVDEKIQALKKKHSLLEQYKKGVMQKLFSQEIRFKDENGNDFPEWEENKFSEYIKLYRGSSPRPINLFTTKESNGVNWIKIGDTKNCKNYLIDNVEEKITIEGAKKSREVFKGELILANSMSFGKTYLLDLDGCIYDGWFVLREFEKHFNREYLHQLLNSEYLQKQYKTLSTGGVVQNISSEIVYDTFLLKPSIKEQTAIANFLSALDEKINHTKQQIEKMEVWKKGLLQKMFV